MMALFLGETVFREGVSDYLENHKYGNAEQDDLWRALTIKAHEYEVIPKSLTIKTIMDTWTVQTGYPILTINRDYGNNGAYIHQERYLRNPAKLSELAPQCWWVPLVYTTEHELDFNKTRSNTWLECNNKKQYFERFPDDNEWVIFNVRGTGIYRVNYDEQNWNMLIKTLNSDRFKDISVFSRVQLLEDSNFLAISGHIKYTILFDLHNYLGRETEFIAWNAGFNTLFKISAHMKRTAHYGYFRVSKKILGFFLNFGCFLNICNGL